MIPWGQNKLIPKRFKRWKSAKRRFSCGSPPPQVPCPSSPEFSTPPPEWTTHVGKKQSWRALQSAALSSDKLGLTWYQGMVNIVVVQGIMVGEKGNCCSTKWLSPPSQSVTTTTCPDKIVSNFDHRVFVTRMWLATKMAFNKKIVEQDSHRVSESQLSIL